MTIVNDIYFKLNTCGFTCTFNNKYTKRSVKVIFHTDQIEGDKLVFNKDFFNIDKKVDEIYEIVTDYNTLWYDDAYVYQYDSMLAERKLICKISRNEYVDIMQCIHKKMV